MPRRLALLFLCRALTLWVPFLGLTPLSALAAVFPRIVNGSATFAHPAVGMVLFYDDASRFGPNGMCSGTLIGCRTFLTAAHCVCPDWTDSFASCVQEGVVDPQTVRVLFQNSGYLDVESISVDPAYQFAIGGDLAILTLAQPVTAIVPMAINTLRRPDPGQRGIVVGFGNTSVDDRVDDAGIKRWGVITTGLCAEDIPQDTHICWNFEGVDASTCEGDSGGPLLTDLGDGLVLAGVTSGGSSFDCLPPDVPFNTDVFVERDWLIHTAGADLDTAVCGPFSPVGTAPTQTLYRSGHLDTDTPGMKWTLSVPPGTAELRVTFNGVIDGSGRGTDFDLFVVHGEEAGSGSFDCKDVDPGNFGACVVYEPQPGTWSVAVERYRGQGEFQASMTLLSSKSATCAGDCNTDGETTIDEIILAVSIALEASPGEFCGAADLDGDGKVTIDELVVMVNHALVGCG